MKRPSLVVLAALAGAACQDHTTSPDGTLQPDDPVFEILDGAHGPDGDVGNPNFFFLPPVVRGFPHGSGTFNPDLEPIVQVCLWDEGESEPCVAVVAEFTTDPEAKPHIAINRKHEFYMVIWKTRDSGLEAGNVYRIRVIVSGFELGHADVKVVSNFWQWLKVLIRERDEFVPVKERSRGALPIPFRIEQGAISYAASGGEFTGCAQGQQCGEEVVTLVQDPQTGQFSNPEDETVTANDERGDAQAGVFIPAGGLIVPGGGEPAAPSGSPALAPAQENGSEQAVITVRRIELPEERERCLPTDLPQFEGCYQVEIFPETAEIAPEQFIEIGVCQDHSTLSPEQQALLQLHRYDADDPEPEVQALELTSVGFLECTDFIASNESGWLGNFASSTWQRVASMFGPEPLHASGALRHDGLGGRSGEASDFGWALPAKWELWEGNNQNAGRGQPVPVDPAVRVTDANDDPVENATMTFAVQQGGGTVVPMVVTTGADGVGRVDSWTLGAAEGQNVLTATANGLSGVPTTLGALPTTSISFFASATDFCGFGPANSTDFVHVTHDADCIAPDTVRSVAEALYLVEPGGTVDIAADGLPHLVQRLVVDQPVTFTSDDEGRPTIDAGGSAFSFIVNAVPSGAVVFEHLEFVDAGTYNIWAQGTYDQVIVQNVHFQVTGTSGITAQPSTEPGAKVTVSGSQFSGPSTVPFASVGTFAVGADFDVLNSTFSGFSFSGIQYQTGATGRIEGNTVSECGVQGCIRTVNLNGAAVEIIDNDVSVDFGSAARWGIVGDDGPMVIQDNRVTGVGNGASLGDRASYPFEAGIRIGLVALGSPGPGNATTLSDNTVTNAAVGIQTEEAQVAGSDNFVVTAHTGIEDLASSSGSINWSDISGYQVAIDGEGNLDLTCNWWGSASGPSAVAPTIGVGVYTPWAIAPVAGPGSGSCTGGGGEAPPAGYAARAAVVGVPRTPLSADATNGPIVIISGKRVRLPIPQ